MADPRKPKVADESVIVLNQKLSCTQILSLRTPLAIYVNGNI